MNNEISGLPYIFKDPHKLDKKIDPKKLYFGSRIDENSGEREEYYSVREVISPELMRLSNGLVVRLIGIKTNKALNSLAINLLIDKIKGQKVFLKFDSQKYDNEHHLLCYIYLKNKTFLNAHLIKEGLAEVDSSIDFKYKNKFMELGDRHG